MFKNFNQKGTVLLITLLIIIGIIVTTAGLAFVVISELQQSRNLDYSIVAYYAGETAVENGLYRLRKTDATLDSLDASGQTMENDAEWSRTTQGTENQIYGSLTQNDSFSLELFDPDNLEENPGIESVQIKKNNWTGDEDTWTETTLSEWSADPTVRYQRILKRLYSPSTDPMVNDTPLSYYVYELKIKALYGDIPSFIVTAWDGNGGDNGSNNQVPIPGRAVITGIGDYKNSSQAVKVSLPRHAPLSGIFDYIIYSEEDISK